MSVKLTMLLVLLLSVTVFSVDGSENSELSDPTWEDVFTSGGMHISAGRTKRFVQLSDNQPDIAYQECTLPNGKPGHCRHLKYCMQDEFKRDFMKFINYMCIIKGFAIGACCPDDKENNQEGLAGDLPATATKEEVNEAILKITRAENRGCGLSTRASGRVLGARPANPREWPWVAFIIPEGFEQYCGGVLITNQHVLTAAHCTRRWKAEELFVRLGEYDFKRTNDSRSYTFRVIEIKQHADFDLPSYHHDIAILKLHRPAVFNTYVWPICLPAIGLKLVNETVVVIGWGTKYYGGPTSNVLMEVSLPVWEHQKCVDSFADSIFEETICAGGYEGGKDACQGDSGGPLMYQMSSGRWAVVGVVSWGLRCGEANHPGVYTSIDRYLGWIIENVQF